MQDYPVLKQKNQLIIYDRDLIDRPSLALFDPDAWNSASSVVEKSAGRHTVYFLRINEREYVLRHYWRGGQAAKLSKHSYLWLGAEHSRPFREWRLLDTLYRQGLPVPRPAAARTVRNGLVYRGDILTQFLPGTRTLAELAADGAVPARIWERVGTNIRRLHDAGAYHADLNASNVLVDGQENVFLIDWDRGRLRRPARRWQEANLARLARSLKKLSCKEQKLFYSANDWQALIRGYQRI